MTDSIRVADNPDRDRYDVFVGDKFAGYAAYQAEPGRVVFTHTEIDDSFEGDGVGSALAAGALDDARSRGLLVKPVCPFIARYIEHHPEYADLISPDG